MTMIPMIGAISDWDQHTEFTIYTKDILEWAL